MTLTSGRARSSAAHVATLCLIAIQVGIGVLIKSSQGSSGRFGYSPTSSVTISEFLKLLVSLCLFALECSRRARQGVRPRNHRDGNGYALVATSPDDDPKDDSGEDGDGSPLRLTLSLFWQYVCGEIPTRTRYDIYNLALLYVLVNNTIFACYKLSDPGTIALIKGSGAAVTALLSVAAIGTTISSWQWAAIALQLCGIAITQYRPNGEAAYSLTTYLLLAFHVLVGAAAGVYNQVLLKREAAASLHASNMILYAAGCVFNLVAYLIVYQTAPGEPSFFDGYNKLSAVLVIVSNVFVGLAVTAVLKCTWASFPPC